MRDTSRRRRPFPASGARPGRAYPGPPRLITSSAGHPHRGDGQTDVTTRVGFLHGRCGVNNNSSCKHVDGTSPYRCPTTKVPTPTTRESKQPKHFVHRHNYCGYCVNNSSGNSQGFVYALLKPFTPVRGGLQCYASNSRISTQRRCEITNATIRNVKLPFFKMGTVTNYPNLLSNSGIHSELRLWR